MKRTVFVTALLSGAGALALAMPMAALGQTVPVTPSKNVTPPQKAPEQVANEAIVVTGSRVITNGNNSPTPLTVVSSEQLLRMQPTTITDALNNLPVFSGSRGQFSNPNTTGLYGGGNPASSQLNLRNLGPQRTLILFDGQRLAPGNAIGIVDVDMVPQMLIKRVDVVTGGASAVYGSDAIAGVVNYVTDHNFNGLKIEGGAGISRYSDDKTWRVGIAAGKKLFDGRGHIEISYNHYNDTGIPHRSARPYSGYALVGSVPGSTAAPGTAANPYGVYNTTTINTATIGGLIGSGALKGYTFNTNGVPTAFTHGVATGTTNTEVGGDGYSGGQDSLKAPMRFNQAFLRFDFDFNDNLHFHTEASGNWKHSYTYSANTLLAGYTFSSTNAFLSPAVQSALSASPTFTMSESLNDFPLVKQTADVANYFVNVGFEGKLGKFNWGVDGNYSYNSIKDTLDNNINYQRLSAALDAVAGPGGSVVCRASLTNSTYAGCQPLNLFGPTAANAAAISYVTSTTHYTPTFQQVEAGGHIGGPLFALPAGTVNASLSGEFRKQSFWNGSDATPSDPLNCTDLRYNCTNQASPWLNAFATSPKVSQQVKEVAVEFNAPLLADVHFFKALNLNGAARYTSYDYGGNNITWKVGVDWRVSPDVKLRGTVSKDIEAPSLSQLFQPLLVGPVTQRDYLTQTNPATTITNLGNPNLVSEVGHTITGGIVISPSAIPHLSISADFYQVKVTGALTQLQGYNPQLQAYCYASGGTAYYCSLQTRRNGFSDTSAANAATGWYAIFANIASIETRGLDFELNYWNTIANHRFNARILANYQPYYTISQPGLPTYQEANVAFPNVVPLQAIPAVRIMANLDVAVTPKLMLSLTERFRGRMDASAVPTDVYVASAWHIPSLSQSDLNLSYTFRPETQVYFNVRNIFNQMPPGVSGLSKGAGYPGIDDPTGRYISAGFRYKF